MSSSAEHRWGQRVPANVAVVITRDGCVRGVGRVSDVSLSGALLTTALEVPVHADISVSLPGENAEPREIPACVVRSQSGSLAIEWRDMASPQVMAFIRGIAPDGAGLETRDPCAA
ncbi:MAG: PilZ domain-containing protein [Pseudomonadota bacterium]